MRRRALRSGVLVLAAALAPAVARADPALVPPLPAPTLLGDKTSDAVTGDTWTTRPRAFSLSGASGGPLGYGGASFEYAPRRWLVLGGGAGVQPGGATFAFTWRLRWPISRNVAIGMGVPISAGPYEWAGWYVPPEGCVDLANCPFRVTRTWTMAAWVHFEPSIEFRIPSGPTLRVYGGRSQILNGPQGVCASAVSAACPTRQGETQTYAGITLGYAF